MSDSERDDKHRARSPPRSERRDRRRRRRARRDLHRALGYYYHPAAAAGHAMGVPMGHAMGLDSFNSLAVCPVVTPYGLPAPYHPPTAYGLPYYPPSNAFVECDNGEGESRVLSVHGCALAQEHTDVYAGCSSVLNTDAQVEECVRAYTMFRH